MNPLDPTPSVLTIPEILRKLEEFPRAGLPREVLAAAVARQEEITPELLRVVAEVVEQPEVVMQRESCWLHMFAIFLLAEFREAAAYPLPWVRAAKVWPSPRSMDPI